MANKTQSFDERINAEDTAEDYFKNYCRKEESSFMIMALRIMVLKISFIK